MSRDAAIDAFLAGAGWGKAARRPLAGDASARRYERLEGGAVLMDSPEEDVRPFLRVARAMRGLSVPRILAADAAAGLVLMEDLGDALFSAHLQSRPGDEALLYAEAARALGVLQRLDMDLPDYRASMPDLAGLAVDWYAPEAGPRAPIVAAMGAALDAMPPAPDVPVHRDFHVDNLLWLPERAGTDRVGIIDFQDAMSGPAEYDLASLLMRERRAPSAAARAAAMDAFAEATGRAGEAVAHRYAVCLAQRSLRVLGVFARLCLRDGKTRYPAMIPLVWDGLQEALAHPALGDLAAACAALPPPDAARLDGIVARASTRRNAA